MHEAKDLALSIFKLLSELRLLDEHSSPAHEILLDTSEASVRPAVENLKGKLSQTIGLVDAFQKQKVYNERFMYQGEGLKSTLLEWADIIEGYLAISGQEDSQKPDQVAKYNEWRSKQTAQNLQTDQFLRSFTSDQRKKSRIAPILASIPAP